LQDAVVIHYITLLITSANKKLIIAQS
jgi:hypothetical protein